MKAELFCRLYITSLPCEPAERARERGCHPELNASEPPSPWLALAGGTFSSNLSVGASSQPGCGGLGGVVCAKRRRSRG